MLNFDVSVEENISSLFGDSVVVQQQHFLQTMKGHPEEDIFEALSLAKAMFGCLLLSLLK